MGAPRVPRILWMFWAQGWDQAPEVVGPCVKSWKAHNPDWDIRLLTAETIAEHLADPSVIQRMLDEGQPLEAVSNLLRVELIIAHGGVWADATAYCLRPLSEWIDDAAKGGFFAFADPGADRKLSSWFLAGHPGNAIATKWRDATVRYWDGRSERHIYFWFHGLFKELYHQDPEFREAWDACTYITARGPHIFTPAQKRLLNPPGLKEKLIAGTAATPLVKLSHKLGVDPAEIGPETAYRWMLERDPKGPLPGALAKPLRSVASGLLKAATRKPNA
ncbi:capsular polysaccharide synthesis protein [Parvularcula lutaonensis]|uniref:Capsular polysaccharide synthesis protein n=1 Tax=Parvularcula lutaonensis TaxID=491923 RepID=A0ABV7MDV9_9PROT|nr:capsular polysaccharide synthesis protein [Parvularcula lutaonensis]GGY49489.1 hypothetical protein GCM10007148_17590 [Parvularcula lutaonensis]